MKNIKKILGGALMAIAAFGFFGCSDEEEDDELEVTISYDSSTQKVTMSTPDKYEGKDVYIAYTLDGSELSVTYNKDKYDEDAKNDAADNILDYFEYGTATIYTGAFKLTGSSEITAKAFYINDSGKAVYGPLAKKTATIENAATTTDSADNAKGTLSFAFSTGNNLYHYYDTSAKTFEYTYDGKTYEHCYYQIQFSYKGTGKGNWYLYVRQLGAGQIIPASSTQKFIASGTYTGSCFDNSNGSVTTGDLKLYKSSDANSVWKTVSVTDAGFDLEVTGTAESLADDAK